MNSSFTVRDIHDDLFDHRSHHHLQGEGIAKSTSLEPTPHILTKPKKKRDGPASSLRKAPGAPKRFKSSYILFFMEKQKEIKTELGEGASVGAISKRSSEKWKSLPPEERAIWDAKAEADKKRYNLEKEKYTGPWQVPWKRAKKNPNAPKRPMSAFLFYSQDKRRIIKEQKPGIRNTEISKILGEMWKKASTEERAPHIEREATQREKYKVEIAKWRKEEAARTLEQEHGEKTKWFDKTVSSETDCNNKNYPKPSHTLSSDSPIPLHQPPSLHEPHNYYHHQHPHPHQTPQYYPLQPSHAAPYYNMYGVHHQQYQPPSSDGAGYYRGYPPVNYSEYSQRSRNFEEYRQDYQSAPRNEAIDNVGQRENSSILPSTQGTPYPYYPTPTALSPSNQGYGHRQNHVPSQYSDNCPPPS